MTLLWGAILGGQAARVDAAELITNGGFEFGFAGWTRANQLGSDGSFLIQTGTTSPVNGIPVPAPPGGTNAAMTDAQGPGSHVLYQDIVVPFNVTVASLSFSRYLNNQAADYFSPNTLDFTSVNNQQARVDILRSSADPFSLSAADELLNVFRTQPGDPLVSGYSTVVTDLTSFLRAHAGETLRLRFAEVDNQLTMNFGVDNVSLNATAVPEPSSLFGLSVGVSIGVALAIRSTRRRS